MNTTRMALGALSILCSGLVLSNVASWRRLERLELASSRAEERTHGEPPELAPYMGELQRLTHKLQLSLAAENLPLAEFYLYESRELVREMSSAVPEYRGQAIALLAERTLEPAYAAVETALRSNAPRAELRASSREVVGACNGCHRLTRHAFVHVAEITPEDNPYAQRFEPQEKHDPHEIAHRNEAHRSRQNH